MNTPRIATTADLVDAFVDVVAEKGRLEMVAIMAAEEKADAVRRAAEAEASAKRMREALQKTRYFVLMAKERLDPRYADTCTALLGVIDAALT